MACYTPLITTVSAPDATNFLTFDQGASNLLIDSNDLNDSGTYMISITATISEIGLSQTF